MSCVPTDKNLCDLCDPSLFSYYQRKPGVSGGDRESDSFMLIDRCRDTRMYNTIGPTVATTQMVMKSGDLGTPLVARSDVKSCTVATRAARTTGTPTYAMSFDLVAFSVTISSGVNSNAAQTTINDP